MTSQNGAHLHAHASMAQPSSTK